MKIEIKRQNGVIAVILPKYFFIGNIIVIGFDCEKLEFIDSSAIGTLVKFFNSSVKKNIDMYVFGLNSDLQKIFDTTKIDRVMSVVSKDEFLEKNNIH